MLAYIICFVNIEQLLLAMYIKISNRTVTTADKLCRIYIYCSASELVSHGQTGIFSATTLISACSGKKNRQHHMSIFIPPESAGIDPAGYIYIDPVLNAVLRELYLCGNSFC